MAFPANESQVLIGTRDAFNNSDTADFVIKCRDQKFHVHKIILPMRGGFLAGLVSPHFKEHALSEATLEEHQPEVIRAVLQTVYCVKYDCPTSVPAAYFEAQLYAAADFFQLPHLKDISLLRFQHALDWGRDDGDDDEDDDEWMEDNDVSMASDVASVDETGASIEEEDEEGISTLATPCANDCPPPAISNTFIHLPSSERKNFKATSMSPPTQVENANIPQNCMDIAHYVYTSTPDSDRGLRNIVVSIINANFESLITDAEHNNAQTLESLPELARELIVLRGDHLRSRKGAAGDKQSTLRCGQCRQTWTMARGTSETDGLVDVLGETAYCSRCQASDLVYVLERNARAAAQRARR